MQGGRGEQGVQRKSQNFEDYPKERRLYQRMISSQRKAILELLVLIQVILMIIQKMNRKTTFTLFFLIIFLSGVVEVNSLCPAPQKSIYISLNSLSKRDHMQLLFTNISKQTKSYNITYGDPLTGKGYFISQLKYILSYNNHYQHEQYLDGKSIRVTLGVVNLLSEFNYEVKDKANQTQFKGIGYARSFLDPSHIEKELVEKDGFVEWEARVIQLLEFNSLWVCESLLDLPEKELHIFQKMVNNVVNVTNIRPQIQTQINLAFKIWLKQYLNSDHLISTKDIVYTFRNLTINLTHKNQNISIDNLSNGLLSFISFGVSDSGSADCGNVPQKYSEKDYGGVVETFTFQSIKSIILEGLNRGLTNVSLDTTWETNVFQLYMGDLSNAVPYADYYGANEPIKVECSLSNKSKIFVSSFDASQIYLQMPQQCLITFNGEAVMEVTIDLTVFARLKAEKDFLSVKVSKIQSRKTVFASLKADFKVQRTDVGEMIVQSILDKVKEGYSFGTKIPLLDRKYPSLLLSTEYLIVFDASEFFENSPSQAQY